MNKKGLLIILSGPSGVGKGTIRKKIMKNPHLNLVYSISMTTRLPRPREQDGVDYYFVTPKVFQENIDCGNFLEWAEFVGNRYGTPKDKLRTLCDAGKNVFLEIEINGASQVLGKIKNERVISFFLMPPSLKALEKRIRKRRSEPEEIIQQRLAKGKKEMTMTENYDYVIMNDWVGRAANEITKIILKKIASLNS